MKRHQNNDKTATKSNNFFRAQAKKLIQSTTHLINEPLLFYPSLYFFS